jgi:ribosomal protein S12 methylthiotransferase accessory factor
MAMEITFPGGAAVNAEFKGFTIQTDQPEKNGGKNTAPAPFDLFLASIGTCAGFYAVRFCQERQIDTAGLRVTLDTAKNPETHRVDTVSLRIQLPPGFPEKYRAAILRSVDQCSVKKHILEPPKFDVQTV